MDNTCQRWEAARFGLQPMPSTRWRPLSLQLFRPFCASFWNNISKSGTAMERDHTPLLARSWWVVQWNIQICAASEISICMEHTFSAIGRWGIVYQIRIFRSLSQLRHPVNLQNSVQPRHLIFLRYWFHFVLTYHFQSMWFWRGTESVRNRFQSPKHFQW